MQLMRSIAHRPGRYQCDRCSTIEDGKRLPRGWHKRDEQHWCAACWKTNAPAERTVVYRYHVPRNIVLPEQFWHEQHAARLLWNGLCTISTGTLQQVDALRARYAAAEAATARTMRERATTLWESLNRTSTDEQRQAARAASVAATKAAAVAKQAARAAGCNEQPLWAERDRELAAAVLWTYALAEQDGRAVQRSATPGAWRIHAGLAYQTVEDYRRAWRAWQQQRPAGRRMPRPHKGPLERVRAVARYTNGTSLAALDREPSAMGWALRPLPEPSDGGNPRYRLHIGDSMVTDVVVDWPLPDGAVITMIQLSGQRWADRWQWALHVTCRSPHVPHPRESPVADAVAVDLRWRVVPDERSCILVAAWGGTDGSWGRVEIDRAQTMRYFHRAREDDTGQEHKPSSWNNHFLRQAVVDWCLEGVKAVVWQRHDQGEKYGEPFRLLRSRGLYRQWRAGQYPLADAELTCWWTWHCTQLRRLARLRDRLVARRDQLYYEKAHDICKHTRVIVLESERGQRQAMDLRPLITMDDAPAADQRQIVAPGRFRQILLHVAAQYNDHVALREKHRTSTTCSECGAQATPGPREFLRCAIGHRFSQIDASIAELLRRWREQPDDDGNGGSARGTQAAGKSGRTERKASDATISQPLEAEPLAQCSESFKDSHICKDGRAVPG